MQPSQSFKEWLHTQTRSCTLSYCNHGRKIVDAITWRIKHTRLQKWLWLVLSSLPWKSLQVTKQKAKQSTATNHYYMKEHSTININIINLDASSQLYRLCISILIGFLPCDVRHLVSLQVDLYQAKERETWHDYYLGEREWECEREWVRVRDRDGEREREWYFRELLLLLGLLLDLCLLQKYISLDKQKNTSSF